ncbi:hypothetical protein F2Q68_00015666 [Brassica cretica]|nr:hypothetical protein F2Q68_00015666 [Brassica cretica]
MHTEEYDEDYEEERAIEQRATLDEEDSLLHHSSWRKKSPSIDRNSSTSIDTQLPRPNHLRASTNIAYYPSINSRFQASIDNHFQASVDDIPPHSHTIKSKPDFHTRGEIDQLVEGMYRALEITQERLDRR